MPRYLDPNAFYSITSAHRTANLAGESAPLNKKIANNTLTATSATTIEMERPNTNRQGQLWVFFAGSTAHSL